MMRRRDLLVSGAAALAWPSAALGFGEVTRVDVAELKSAATQSRPSAWKRLLYEIESTTSIEVRPRVAQVAATDAELFEHPFTVLVGRDAYEFDDVEVEQLSRYLSYGGFLVIDETTGADQSDFDRSTRELARRLFPTRPLAPIPRDHSVYRSFFLIDRPVGRLARFPELEAVTVGSVAPLIYCRNDLSGALERKDNGQFVSACVPNGESQRREALKLGINLMMYSLTANYKKDQAHVVALKKQGRLE